MKMTEETVEEMISRLEKSGDIDPTCRMCQEIFYPAYKTGITIVFAPRHKASSRCQSGKHSHCTCDTCF